MLAPRAQALNAPLATPRLFLEPLAAWHADAFFVLLADERIYQWVSSQPPKDVEDLREAWRRRGSRLSPDGSHAWLDWAVRRASDGVYVGRLDASVDTAGVATNFGYIFSPDYWSQGYATECSRALVEHFARHDVHEVRAYVTRGNVASERVLVKSGFVRTRVLVGNDRLRGVLHDDIEYIYRAAT